MTSSRPLPIHPRPARPTVDAMRRQLGGRISDDEGADAGRLVLASLGEEPIEGVVLSADEGYAYLWTGADTVRRVPRESCRPLDRPVSDEEAARMLDAQTFARLAERGTVRFVTPRGRVEEGVLVERCRFGGLVGRPDGTIVAVGFQRLAPADAAH